MKKSLLWRSLLAGSVFVLAFYFLLPVVFPQHRPDPSVANPSLLQRILPDSRINLGLDLRGGIQLTLGVDVAKAMQNNLAQLGQDIVAAASEQGLLMTSPKLVGDEKLEFIFTLPDKLAEFQTLLSSKFPQMVYAEPKVLPNGRLVFSMTLADAAREELADMLVEQALTVIRSRIDQFGVAEPDIRKQQDGRISVQLPGVDNTQRAIGIIGQTAQLEFRIARPEIAAGSFAPSGTEFLPLKPEKDEPATERKIAVDSITVLTGKHITRASVEFDKDKPFVSLSFDKRGREIFSKVTGENAGGYLAIVLDGIVHSAPYIKTQIDGDVSITGSFSLEEAMDLALVLRAGALPAPVIVLEERTVGPSLGQESIDMGVKAAVIGGAAVMLFILVYYGLSGFIANLMLLLDVVLILAGLAVFGATLTLPGIAGIVLTLGMAVDANVLIFERIREEIANGVTDMAEAVEAGFSKASLAIVDSNLTTVIAAVLLYQFGTGPVRGFAVTLTLGILASMFTAVFVSRIIFNAWMSKPGRKLSI